MKGIPHTIQTRQDLLNIHRLAMSNRINRKEWKTVLLSLIQPNKYVFPILKVEDDCFYIPYTDIPLPYKRVNKVMAFNETNNLILNNANIDVCNNDQVRVEFISNPNYHLPEIINESEFNYPMLQIFHSIDKQLNQLAIYYGYPFYDITGITFNEIQVLLKELI